MLIVGQNKWTGGLCEKQAGREGIAKGTEFFACTDIIQLW